MSAVLDTKVLVLNKYWHPIKTVTAFDAISDVYVGKAEIIDKDYCTYDFDRWINNWSDLYDESEVKHRIVNTSKLKFIVPEIIKYVGTSYQGNFGSVKFSRKNIFRRDGKVCQYCNREFPIAKLNIDHVTPRSKGGRSTWENVVVSCIKCNSKKMDKYPNEAGMKLIKVPVKPKFLESDALQISNSIPTSWENFVSHLYWNTELHE